MLKNLASRFKLWLLLLDSRTNSNNSNCLDLIKYIIESWLFQSYFYGFAPFFNRFITFSLLFSNTAFINKVYPFKSTTQSIYSSLLLWYFQLYSVVFYYFCFSLYFDKTFLVFICKGKWFFQAFLLFSNGLI